VIFALDFWKVLLNLYISVVR